MELQRDWGKGWTYLFLVLVMLAIAGFGWYLLEEKRDQNAQTFYEVSKDNYDQIQKVISITKLLPESQGKTELLETLSKTMIIRTVAEYDSINAINDSIPEVPTDSIVEVPVDTVQPPSAPIFVLSDVNSYETPNAANRGNEIQSTDSWESINGAKISVTGRASSGNYGVEVDGAEASQTGAKTTFVLDPEAEYELSVDVRKNTATPAMVSLENPSGSIMSSFEIKAGTEFQTINFKFNTKTTAILKVVFMAPSKDGEEIYIDNVSLNKYVEL